MLWPWKLLPYWSRHEKFLMTRASYAARVNTIASSRTVSRCASAFDLILSSSAAVITLSVKQPPPLLFCTPLQKHPHCCRPRSWSGRLSTHNGSHGRAHTQSLV